MAAASEYSMLFKLSAKLGGEFQSTFGKANSSISETQREIIALNRTQGDIAAYQKQQKAVESTERKLADLRKEYDNIQREIQETEGFSSDLENKLIEKQRAIDKTSESLNNQTDKLHQMGSALQEAGVDTDHLTDESENLKKKMDDLAQKQATATKEAQQFGKEGVSAFDAVGSAMVAAGIAAGLKSIYDEYKECISIAADFEETMSTVEALSGASVTEMKELSSYAKELGATTKFTAKESAEAMTYMAMAGWDAEQMLDGMSGLLNLAAASGEDLAATADIVTDNLTAFGLKASDTARFSDVLAAAATNSNTSVAIMGETFKNSAALAGALGYSIEDVAVAIGLMANAGIKGSNAGTALKNIFNGLLSGVTLTSEAFGEVEYSAINADGTMKSFGETLQDLRGYFAQMTGAEKLQNAEAIAGQRAMAGFVSIMNSTDAEFEKLTNNIENCNGAAQKMADIKMDNLNGQITLLNSATDALKTTIGEAYNKEFRWLAKVGTDILTSINDFLSKHPILLKTLIAMTASVGAFVVAYNGYIAAKKIMNTVRALNTALMAKEAVACGTLAGAEASEAAAAGAATAAQKSFNTALTTTASTIGPLVALIGAYALVVAYLADYAKGVYDEAMADVKEFQSAIEEYKSSLESMTDAYEETISVTDAETEAAEEYLDRLKELEAQGSLTSEQQAEYNTLIERLKALMPNLNVELDENTGLLVDGADALERQIQARKEQIRLEAIHDLAVQRERKRYELQFKYNEALKKQTELQKSYDAAVAYSKRHDNSGNMASSQGGLSFDVDMFTNGVDVEASKKALEEQNDAVEEAKSLLDEAEGEVNDLWAEYEKLSGGIDGNTSSVDANNDAQKDALTTIDDVIAKIDALKAAYDEAYSAAYESISGQYSLWDTAAVVIPTDIETINTALETQISYWSDYNTDLTNLISRAGDIEGLSDVIASFADGSTESVNAIAGMAAASDEDLRKMVAQWQEVQKQQEGASGSIAELTTGYSSELDTMKSELESAVDALNLSDEAGAAAKSTVDSYVQAIRSGTGDAVAAAASLRSQVAAALKSGGSGGVPGYARGTENAQSGLALVGEKGPELVMFNGGEQVLTTDETRAYLRQMNGGHDEINAYAEGTGEYADLIMILPALERMLEAVPRTDAVSAETGQQSVITIAPTFNVQGGGDIEETLRSFVGELKDEIMDALEESGVDAKRVNYA